MPTSQPKHEIQVSVRVRPPENSEQTVAVSVSDSGEIVIDNGKQKCHFSYPTRVVLGSDQILAYDALISNLIKSMNDGFSTSLLAYGQTGSGKTHTMFGPPNVLTESALEQAQGGIPESWGVFPRTLMHLLGTPGLKLQASAIEIYQNQAFDLLANRRPLRVGKTNASYKKSSALALHPSGCYCRLCFAAEEQAKNERTRRISAARSTSTDKTPTKSSKSPTEDQNEFATVGETLLTLNTTSDIAKLARTVETSRIAQAHLLNARSSRSHCLVRVHMTRELGHDKKVRQQQFLFVDLAGSERIKKSGVTGSRRSEAVGINSSLTVLGRVIKQLGRRSSAGSSSHIPYRDSTLTMLLRSTFGGRSCTNVVINIASAAVHAEESICSLQFGSRVAVVRNKATVVAGKDAGAESESLRAELENAQAILEKMKGQGLAGHFGDDANVSEKRTFEINRKKYAEIQRTVMKLQTTIAETDSDSPVLAALRARLNKVRKQSNDIRDIVLRQKSIRGFWFEPAPAYQKQEANIRDIEARLGSI